VQTFFYANPLRSGGGRGYDPVVLGFRVGRHRSAKARQARERLVLGADSGPWEYVVSNEAGEPYHPQVLSRYWAEAVEAAGVRHIKLHAARHTCATLMHLQGVPVSVIAAWIGHKDASLTLRLYAHSQTEALKAAGATLNRVVSPSCQ
jgi:integrase